MNWKKVLLIISITLISGLCWYLSCGLNGNFWWLLWIAPVPILWISFRLSPSRAFGIAFLAYLIGRLSWLSYLLSVVPPVLATLFTIVLPLIFATIIWINRRIVLSVRNGFVIFAYPALVVSFEYLLFHSTGDGTAGSIAYSQANCLPIIQVASITGILGIVFLVSLFPSLIAWSIFAREKGFQITSSIVVSTIVMATVIIFGIIEVYGLELTKSEHTIGLYSPKESANYEERKYDTPKGDSLIQECEKAIAGLSAKGAATIVLPEKMIIVKEDQDSIFRRKFADMADRYQVNLVVGYTKAKDQSGKNLSWIVSSRGKTRADYMKVNLFEGEAWEGFQRGDSISVFEMDQIKAGTAICKDMDYQPFIRRYGKAGIYILFVPAWDFKKDDWLHSRMAILRGVENGFGIARSARMGRLTISDAHGRIIAEASSSDGRAASAIGNYHVFSHRTVYSYWGDWFAFICLIVAAGFALVSRKGAKRAKTQR